MKLVTEYLTSGEAELAASNLEAAGIATFVSNNDSARIPIATSSAAIVGSGFGVTILLVVVVYAVTRV